MATLLPSIRYRIVDTATGAAIPGAKVYTYSAGTTTPKDSYTSSTAGVANTNPVIADARGEVLIWLSGAYKIRITDADDNVIDEEDNVVDLTSGGTFAAPNFTGTATYAGTSMTWSGNPTHSGNHTFSGNVTINGNTAIGNASSDTLTIAPSAVTWTNGATHSGAHTWSGAQTMSSTLAVTGVATLTGGTAGKGAGTTYTPTLSGATNITGTPTVSDAWYFRQNDLVDVFVAVSLTPTAANTFTTLSITLPVTTAMTQSYHLIGSCWRASGFSIAALSFGTVEANTVSNIASCGFSSASTAAQTWYFHFSYRII